MWGWKLGLALKKAVAFGLRGERREDLAAHTEKTDNDNRTPFYQQEGYHQVEVFPPTTKPPNLKKNGERKIRFELHPPLSLSCPGIYLGFVLMAVCVCIRYI